jgi:hypothetical protein
MDLLDRLRTCKRDRDRDRPTYGWGRPPTRRIASDEWASQHQAVQWTEAFPAPPGPAKYSRSQAPRGDCSKAEVVGDAQKQ